MTPLVIRPSSLPTYPDCSRRMAAKMIPGQIRDWGYELNYIPTGAGAAVGTATHAAAASILEEKMKSGELGNASEAEDRAIEAFAKETHGGCTWDDFTPSAAIAKQQIARLARVYRALVAPKLQPLAVEMRLELKTTRGNTVSGQIDVTTLSVRDLKTGRLQRQNIAQYGAYSMLMRGKGGHVSSCVEDYIKRVPLKQDQPPPTETRYPIELAERVAANTIRRIEQDYELFMVNGDNTAFLANPNSMLCSEKFCPAFGTDFCVEHKR